MRPRHIPHPCISQIHRIEPPPSRPNQPARHPQIPHEPPLPTPLHPQRPPNRQHPILHRNRYWLRHEKPKLSMQPPAHHQRPRPVTHRRHRKGHTQLHVSGPQRPPRDPQPVTQCAPVHRVEAAAQLMPRAAPQAPHRVGTRPRLGDGRVVGRKAQMSREREDREDADVEFEQGAEIEPARQGADVCAYPERVVGGGGNRVGVLLLLLLLEKEGADDVAAQVEQ